MCGDVIERSEHGNRNSEHGWEMDHIVEDCIGGRDTLSNLRPLQWRNNVARGARTVAVLRLLGEID